MGLGLSKFLNTATHFSVEHFVSLFVPNVIAPFANLFIGLVGTMDVNIGGAETTVQTPINGNITIKRIRAIAGANARTQNTTINFRDDGVTVASVVIPAGSVALQDSGALNVAVVGGSLCNLSMDAPAGVGGISNIGVDVEYQAAIA